MSDARPVLAVLGGSFNPPHLGHSMLPAYLLARGDVDGVLVAPCADHPLGKRLAPFEQRMSWVRGAMRHYGARVEVSRIEAELAVASGGKPSYTLALLEALALRRPHRRLRLVVGSDIVESGETERWHRWDRICAAFDPIIVPRAGWSPAGSAALPEVSSTQVRHTLEQLRAGALSEDVARAQLAGTVPGPVVDALLRWVAGSEPRVWIVGHGHVAAHVLPMLYDRGLVPVQLGARALSSAQPPAVPEDPPLGVYLLCRDGALEAVARALVGRVPPGTPVLHAAGARLARSALAPLAEAGHPVGTLHPICSMRSELSHARLASASFGVEYGAQGRGALERLVEAMLGPRAMAERVLDLSALGASERLAYHAACALVANHMAVLQRGAGEVLEGQGFETRQVERALGDLMLGSLTNLLELGVPAGITGPLSRGDRATVDAHIEALQHGKAGATAALYRELSEGLARVLAARE